MTLELALKVLRDLTTYIEANKMFKNGTVDFSNLQFDVSFTTEVEASLKRNGVTIPAQVDAIMTMLPMLLQVGLVFGKK